MFFPQCYHSWNFWLKAKRRSFSSRNANIQAFWAQVIHENLKQRLLFYEFFGSRLTLLKLRAEKYNQILLGGSCLISMKFWYQDQYTCDFGPKTILMCNWTENYKTQHLLDLKLWKEYNANDPKLMLMKIGNLCCFGAKDIIYVFLEYIYLRLLRKIWRLMVTCTTVVWWWLGDGDMHHHRFCTAIASSSRMKCSAGSSPTYEGFWLCFSGEERRGELSKWHQIWAHTHFGI